MKTENSWYLGENIAVKSMAERKYVPRLQYFRKQKNWESNVRWVLHVAYDYQLLAKHGTQRKNMMQDRCSSLNENKWQGTCSKSYFKGYGKIVV